MKRSRLESEDEYSGINKRRCLETTIHGNSSQNTEPVQRETKKDPLFIFLDCETTGHKSIYSNSITKISAKIINSEYTFSRLVKTTQPISPSAIKLTGIRNEMLKHKKPLASVLLKFLKWIKKRTKKISRLNGLLYYPVLVAHNGFRFEFPMLMSEFESQHRRLTRKIHFSDPLPYLQKLKHSGHEDLKETKLGKEELYKHFFTEPHSAHTGLEDVSVMEKLFTASPLKHHLKELPIRDFQEQLKLWHSMKSKYLLKTLVGISDAQANTLFHLGLDQEALTKLKAQFTSPEEFQQKLLTKGVKSKPLREKLSGCIHFK